MLVTVLINPKDILPLALDRSDWPLSTDVKRSKSVGKLKEKVSASINVEVADRCCLSLGRNNF
jgi:hypothetical protein